jgi:hypothetical protein
VHFAASIAASIAASGCRFWLPFCGAKSFDDILLSDWKRIQNSGIEGLRD